MSSSRLHYYQTQIQVPVAAMDAAAQLAQADLHPQHVVYEKDGSWSYAGGSWSEAILTGAGLEVHLPDGSRYDTPWSGDPLGDIDRHLAQVPIADWRAYGWAAFELSYALNGATPAADSGTLLHLIVPRIEVTFAQEVATVRAADPEDLRRTLAVLRTVRPVAPARSTPVDVRLGQGSGYHAAVQGAVEEINAGLLEKVILSRVVELPEEIDLPATYLTGRRGNQPARSFLLNLGGIEALGFSPEIVVTVTSDKVVHSQPLAGTRALTGCGAIDSALRAELLSNPKEIYEHAISVKTGADELVEVCQEGTVQVPEFMAVRERGSVQHLASQVCGVLREENGPWDAFGAVFPAVTASGVPKRGAYECIQRHETERRGLYSGSVFTIAATGEMDAALVLRSAYRQAGRTWLRAGAGIVGQSTPDREFEETCEKLESVARHLVAAESAAVPQDLKVPA